MSCLQPLLCSGSCVRNVQLYCRTQVSSMRRLLGLMSGKHPLNHDPNPIWTADHDPHLNTKP